MRQSISRFEFLFKKYTGKNYSEAERNEFFEMAANELYADDLKRLIQEEVENAKDDRELNAVKADEIFGKILGANNTEQTINISSVKKSYLKWRAVAAILITLAISSYLFFNLSANDTITAKNIVFTPPINDVAPGHSGAILTLSNNQKIILDSMQNGLLTKQGSSNILKEGSQLSYKDNNTSGNKIVYNTLSTPKGRKFQLMLADGSKVWLNAASSITFPTEFSKKERKVEITGEVYFEIKPMLTSTSKKIPFTVVIHSPSGNKREVQVLGTHFNINAYDNESAVKTTLLEGSVEITNNNSSVRIKPGEQAVLDKQVEKISVIDAEVEQVVAWKNGYFSFKNATIETIMRQVERWYDVDVKYNGSKPGGHYRGEVPMDVNASEMLKVLEVSGIRFRIDGKRIIIG